MVLWSGLRWLKTSLQDEAQHRIAGYHEALQLGWKVVLGKPV